MNKTIIWLMLLVTGGVVGMGFYSYSSKKEVAPTKAKANGVMVDDKTISVDVGGKFSMVDLKIKVNGGKLGGFEVNKEVFNSELFNRIEEDGRLHVVVGVLKPSAELPSGKVEVGKMVDMIGGTMEVEGKVTVPSDGEGSSPKEIEVGFAGGSK